MTGTSFRNIFLASTAAVLFALTGSAHAADQTLKFAYSSDFVPLTPESGEKFWSMVTADFEKENPGVKVERVKVPGSSADVVTKMSLLFRNADTAPDIAQVSTFDLEQWISSEYLADITDMVNADPSWKDTPDSVKSMTTLDGKVYAFPHGVNTMALLYDKTLFKKAGISVPWEPKSWNDVLDAARKIKAASPDAWPLWLPTGTAQGAAGATYGPSNLLAGSSDPTIFDKDEGKWVVDSKGLREVIEMYKTASGEGLLAPASQLLNATAIATPPSTIPKHGLGITLAGNWFSMQWMKEVAAPLYAEGREDVGVALLPTKDGQAPGAASTLSGLSLAIYSGSEKKDLAWKFAQLVQRDENLVKIAIMGGWIPPVTKVAESKEYTALDPFQTTFAKAITFGTITPLQPGYSSWAMGLLTATEAVILDPKLSTDEAIQKMSDYVSNQLGPDLVVTKTN